MEYKFWTIMDGDKFLNSNLMRKDNSNIVEAIKFEYEEDCLEFMEGLRKDRNFKSVEVNCEVSECSNYKIRNGEM